MDMVILGEIGPEIVKLVGRIWCNDNGWWCAWWGMLGNAWTGNLFTDGNGRVDIEVSAPSKASCVWWDRQLVRVLRSIGITIKSTAVPFIMLLNSRQLLSLGPSPFWKSQRRRASETTIRKMPICREIASCWGWDWCRVKAETPTIIPADDLVMKLIASGLSLWSMLLPATDTSSPEKWGVIVLCYKISYGCKRHCTRLETGMRRVTTCTCGPRKGGCSCWKSVGFSWNQRCARAELKNQYQQVPTSVDLVETWIHA